MYDSCLMRTGPADTVESREAGTGMRRNDGGKRILFTDA